MIPIGGNPVLYTDYFQGEITYVNRNRLKYVGYNKWLKNFIYWTIDPNQLVTLSSDNP
jgi:hypothetical protein